MENVKRKTGGKTFVSSDDSDTELETSDSQKPVSRPCPPPRQTITSMQRFKLKEKEAEENARHWRPNSSKTDYVPNSILMIYFLLTLVYLKVFSLLKGSKNRQSSAKTQAFYVGGNSNSKGAVFRDYPVKKSIRKSIPTVTIPDKEDPMCTRDWLRKYSLAKLKLDLHKLVSGPECKHKSVSIGTVKKDVTARYCSAFPSINVNGTVRHLQLKKGELSSYTDQCEKVLKRYVKRLQWLLSGSRKFFGTFDDDKCAVLIDTSGSMDEYLPGLKRELASLVWEQFYKNKIWFNFIRFSDRCEKWREEIVEPSEENCHKAIAWLANLRAHGNIFI